VGSIVNTSMAAFQQPAQHPSASSLLSTAPVLPPKSLLPGLLDLNASAQAARPKPPSFESPDGIFAFNPLPGALYLPAKPPVSPPRPSSGTCQIFKVCDAPHPSIPCASPVFSSHSHQTHSTAHSPPASSPSKLHRFVSPLANREQPPVNAKEAAFLTCFPVNDSNRLAYCRFRVGRLGRRIMDQFSIDSPASTNAARNNHRSRLTQRILNRLRLNNQFSVHRSALVCSSLDRTLSALSERARATSRLNGFSTPASTPTLTPRNLPHSRPFLRRPAESLPASDHALSHSHSFPRPTDRRELVRLGELVLDELPDALEQRDSYEPLQKRLRTENLLSVCSLLRSTSGTGSISSDIAQPSGRLESDFLDALQVNQMNLFKPSATVPTASTSASRTNHILPAWPKYPPSLRSLADAHLKRQEADEAAAAAAAYLTPAAPPANFALPDLLREIF
jgi:hypothetical protein